MKKYNILCLLFAFQLVDAQIKILCWNVENLGQSKSANTIIYMAKLINPYDVVAVQEVVSGNGGAQTVAKLANALNRLGNKWDYAVSDPTTSSAYKAERYAFLWKVKSLKKVGNAWLEKKYNLEIDREPFYCTFESKKKQFTLVNFHAITKNRQPETEIKFFKFLPIQYPKLSLIFLGDFNCPQSHTVFIPLLNMGFVSALKNQKTSLKRKCSVHDCLASEFDNIFFETLKFNLINSGIIPFYKDFDSLDEARKISDHLPIFMTFEIN